MCDLENKEFLKELVRRALERLYLYDRDLLELDKTERSISARIAMHLYVLLLNEGCDENRCKYRIDGEYRHMNNSKKSAPENSSHKTMRPDIIIHQRAGRNGVPTQGNILFCEVKQNKESSYDKKKIKKGLSDDFMYLYGLQIYNFKTNNVSVKWYERNNSNSENNNEEVIHYSWDTDRSNLHEISI